MSCKQFILVIFKHKEKSITTPPHPTTQLNRRQLLASLVSNIYTSQLSLHFSDQIPRISHHL